MAYNIKHGKPPEPRFKIWDECYLHEIINGIRQPSKTTCLIVGFRYVHRGSNIYGWEYYIIRDNMVEYSYTREENLSIFKKGE